VPPEFESPHAVIEPSALTAAKACPEADGSITAWGTPYAGGTGAPSGSGYTKIYSTDGTFAALKTNGSIRAAKAPSVE
jgi:hypothetical protein